LPANLPKLHLTFKVVLCKLVCVLLGAWHGVSHAYCVA